MNRLPLLRMALVVGAAGLTGCTTTSTANTPPMQIRYESDRFDKTGLIRVFDMNGKTVLQFFDAAKSVPEVYEHDSSKIIHSTVIGQQIVQLDAIYPSFFIRLGDSELLIGERPIKQQLPDMPASSAVVTAVLEESFPAKPLSEAKPDGPPISSSEVTATKRSVEDSRVSQTRPWVSEARQRWLDTLRMRKNKQQ